ncbi:MAG: hypothetical protein CVU11_07005 [Bacteroidetes bacterium HGW-Bacteroidetes-6]|jgi:single stranded DNA-binding protein|nr:MAG: hypothetical protein CVU11_07005 [Bacteroidetes bacterium HGW-Bacteroidetes-6]
MAESKLKKKNSKSATRLDWPANSVELSGFVGADPFVYKFDNGKTLARFSIGTHQMLRDTSGKWQRITTWHQVLAWQHVAMQVALYVRQGSFVSLQGRLRSKTILDSNQQPLSKVFIVARKLSSNITT